MKRKFCLSLAVFTATTIFPAHAQQTGKITPSGIGYLEYLPDGYHSNSDKYPVVISLHGIKEKGTSSTDAKRIMKDLPRVAYVGLPKYVKQGKKYPFILISPQLKSNHGAWPPSYIIEVLSHVKKTLRVDDKRIYLTGLSLGGLGVWKTAGAYPEVFAAIAPICPGGNAMDRASAMAAENVAAWGFHGSDDRVVPYTVTTKMIEAMNSSPKKPNPPAKFTLFPGMGHIIWDKAYHETHVLNWMLGFRNGTNGSSSSPPANKPPVVNAGPDKTLTLPHNSITLPGHAEDNDGKIVSYHWTKTAGGTVQISGANSAQLNVSDLEEGAYAFRLTVKDNEGASAFDEVKISVRSPENKPPVVFAGSDRTVTIPVQSVSLNGRAEDPDGEVVSYEWTKVSGGPAQLNGVNSPQLTVSDLDEGVYVFRLAVVDDYGAREFDEVTITVRGAGEEDPADEEVTPGESEPPVDDAPPVTTTKPRRPKPLRLPFTDRNSDRVMKQESRLMPKYYTLPVTPLE
jgi:dienelactone hydrolase